jgi:hypothetical protein
VAGIVLLTLVSDLVLSSVVAAVEGESGVLPGAAELARSIGGALLLLGMWAAGGVLLGVLARGPSLATGLGLVWSLVVENLLRGVANALPALEPVTDHLPGTAAGSLARALGAAADSAPGVVNTLPGGTAAGWVAGYLVGCTVASVLLVRRRDLL